MMLYKFGIWSNEKMKIKTFENLDSLVRVMGLTEPLEESDVKAFNKLANAGDTIYVTFNPYKSELFNEIELLWDTSEEALKNTFYSMRDEI